MPDGLPQHRHEVNVGLVGHDLGVLRPRVNPRAVIEPVPCVVVVHDVYSPPLLLNLHTPKRRESADFNECSSGEMGGWLIVLATSSN